MPRGDWFTRAFGEVVADIRDRVVFEPWFGAFRSSPARSPAEEFGWDRPGTAEREACIDPERDFDR